MHCAVHPNAAAIAECFICKKPGCSDCLLQSALGPRHSQCGVTELKVSKWISPPATRLFPTVQRRVIAALVLGIGFSLLAGFTAFWAILVFFDRPSEPCEHCWFRFSDLWDGWPTTSGGYSWVLFLGWYTSAAVVGEAIAQICISMSRWCSRAAVIFVFVYCFLVSPWALMPTIEGVLADFVGGQLLVTSLVIGPLFSLFAGFVWFAPISWFFIVIAIGIVCIYAKLRYNRHLASY